MSALGIPPRVVAAIAGALIVIGVVFAIAGVISPLRAGVVGAALAVVAVVNWRRERDTPS